MFRTKLLLSSCIIGAGVLTGLPAFATLTTFESYSGDVSLTSDGCGTLGTTCPLTINVPSGSTVLSAILYTSTYDLSQSAVAALGGTLSNGTNSTNLTYTALPSNPSADLQLDAGRDDVTSLVQSVVGSGGGAYTFNVTETNTSEQDGEALFVIYSNPSLPQQSVALVDGGASSTGDMTTVNFSSPLEPTNPGFQAQVRVADGFSYDLGGVTNQESSITVNGQTLSNNIGNCYDGYKIDGSCSNGNLIMVGGDTSPLQEPNSDPAGTSSDIDNFPTSPRGKYDLTPLLTDGETSITLDTSNTSLDDNIFALAFLVSGNAGFNAPPPPTTTTPVTTTVPEPGSLALLGGALAGLGLMSRRRQRG